LRDLLIATGCCEIGHDLKSLKNIFKPGYNSESWLSSFFFRFRFRPLGLGFSFPAAFAAARLFLIFFLTLVFKRYKIPP